MTGTIAGPVSPAVGGRAGTDLRDDPVDTVGWRLIPASGEEGLLAEEENRPTWPRQARWEPRSVWIASSRPRSDITGGDSSGRSRRGPRPRGAVHLLRMRPAPHRVSASLVTTETPDQKMNATLPELCAWGQARVLRRPRELAHLLHVYGKACSLNVDPSKKPFFHVSATNAVHGYGRLYVNCSSGRTGRSAGRRNSGALRLLPGPWRRRAIRMSFVAYTTLNLSSSSSTWPTRPSPPDARDGTSVGRRLPEL
jgi:hypothetical protein